MRLASSPAMCGLTAILASAAFGQTPASQPVGIAPRIAWPAGWAMRQPTKPEVKQLGINTELDAGAMLSTYPVTDSADGLSLADWAAHRVELAKAAPAMKNANFSAPKSEVVGGHDAIVYEADVTLKTNKVHFEYVLLRQGDYFCSFALFSPPSHWETTKSAADTLLAALH